MFSEKQRDMYSQFEPDANEIMFGQRTAPDRQLTDQELSKRKRIVLKLVDQKLKFELIELMKKQQDQKIALQDYNNNTTTPSFGSSQTGHGWAIPSNYYDSYYEAYQPSEYENTWQPWTRPVTVSDESSVSRHIPEQSQNNVGAPAFHSTYQRSQLNPNLIELPAQQGTVLKSASTTSSTYRSQSNPNLIELPVQQFEKTEPKRTPTVTSKGNNFPSKQSPGEMAKAEHSQATSLPSGSCALTSRKTSFANYNERRTQKTQNNLLPPGDWKNTSMSQKHTNPFAVRPTIAKETAMEGTLNGNQLTKSLVKPEVSRNATKRKQGHSSDDCSKKMFLTAKNPPHKTSTGHADVGNVATEPNAIKTNYAAANTIKVEDTIDFTTNGGVGDSCSAKTAIRSVSTEWTSLNQLVTDLFRNKSNNWASLSDSDLQLKNRILMIMSVDPNAIRSQSCNEILMQRFGDKKFDGLIYQSNIVLRNLSRTDPENQASFFKSQNVLIENVRKRSSQQETVNTTQKFSGPHSKIASIISPFMCPGQNHNDCIENLIMNPYSLLSNDAVKKQIVAKGQSVQGIMKSIKIALEEFIKVRLPKKFHVPSDQFIDVPFVVKLFNRTEKMTKASAIELNRVLIDSINCMKVKKPSLRNIQFKDGVLEILCINTMSFDWLKNTLSNHLGVDIRPVKNPIRYHQLKTICLKFHAPQYFHFNNLMEQLRVDNPRLLTKRWELRSVQSKDAIDSTKCVYVGVDVDSLIVLEQMNRVGTLRGSPVNFEISYEDTEENFEKMDFVKKKNYRKIKFTVDSM